MLHGKYRPVHNIVEILGGTKWSLGEPENTESRSESSLMMELSTDAAESTVCGKSF